MEGKYGDNTQILGNSASQDDQFYDSVSPAYDNSGNNQVHSNTGTPTSDPEENARLRQEWQQDLLKLEDEIATLKQVLGAKVRASTELKRKLGITPMAELKHDVQHGIQQIKDSDTYQKTNQTLKNVGQKTSTMFSSVGSYTSKKLGDMRNSNTFKSIEEKMSGAVSNVKSRVAGSKSENSFEDVLTSSKDDTSIPSTPTTNNAS